MATSLPLLNLGVAGLKRAKAREQLSPSEAWRMLNCRSYQGKLETSPGVSQFISGTVAGRPQSIIGWQKDDDTWRLNVFTNTKIYSVNVTSGVITEITRAAG